MANPVFEENERMRRWNGSTSKILRFYRETPAGLWIPRGFIGQLIGMVKRAGETYQIEDQRRTLPPVSLTFTGQVAPISGRGRAGHVDPGFWDPLRPYWKRENRHSLSPHSPAKTAHLDNHPYQRTLESMGGPDQSIP